MAHVDPTSSSGNQQQQPVDVEQAMLDAIAADGQLVTDAFADAIGVQHQAVVGSLKSLESGKLV